MSVFDENVATQVACLFLEAANGSMYYLKLIKLMYMCEQESIKEYKMPFIFDRLFSLEHGPILSSVYDLIKSENDLDTVWKRHIQTQKKKVNLIHDYEEDYLSVAHKQIVREIFERHRSQTRWQVRDLTHDFPEWKNPIPLGLKRMKIDYKDFFGEHSQEFASDIVDFIAIKEFLKA